ncbi:MAG: hypothetical protein AB9873_01150 [Syntrophobacteraceae bacterium]
MIGAIQSTDLSMVPTTRTPAAPVQAAPQVAQAPESPPLMEQVTDLLESREAAANAIIQAQITIFKEGLDISSSMAQQMLKMLEGSQLLAKSASTPPQPTTSLNVIA